MAAECNTAAECDEAAELPDLKGRCAWLAQLQGFHDSPIYYECQTQSAKVLALPLEWADQDNNNSQPIRELQVMLPFMYFDLAWFILEHIKGT